MKRNDVLAILGVIIMTILVVLFCDFLDKNCSSEVIVYTEPTAQNQTENPTNIYPSFIPNLTDKPTIISPTPTTTPTPSPTLSPTPTPSPTPFLVLDAVEKHIFASLLRLEVGSSSYECQMAAASVVVNRMLYDNKSFREVVYEKNQFSVAKWIDPDTGKCYKKPLEINWRAVEDICQNGPTLPYYVMYFRDDYYHKWSTPYFELDGTYFSYIEDEIYK